MKIKQVHSKGIKLDEELLNRFNEAPISEILGEQEDIETLEKIPNRDIEKDAAEVYKILNS